MSIADGGEAGSGATCTRGVHNGGFLGNSVQMFGTFDVIGGRAFLLETNRNLAVHHMAVPRTSITPEN